MTSRPPSIEVENLSKSYVISHNSKQKPRTLRELLSNPFRRQHAEVANIDADAHKETFWALQDVSFTIGEGERVAIVGGNGAGKSTLLKILSRITEPTRGRVAIHGKVSSLLEVGTGFHPELTGRENIFLNGAILGMRRSEIAAKFDQIVDFSGVEKFIDTPVKHYSSGMYVRLAFSVSAWLDPDILIVDEVLSVGDQAFQRKCADRMKELTGAGRTVLFVSHSMQAIKAMCEKAIFLERGRCELFGSVEDAATQYLRSIASGEGEGWHRARFDPSHDIANQYGFDDRYLECTTAYLCNSGGDTTSSFTISETINVCVRYKVKGHFEGRYVPNFHVFDEFGARVFVAYPESPAPSAAGSHEVVCEIPAFVLNSGRYSIMLVMSTFDGGLSYKHHFSYEGALRLEVTEPPGSDHRRHGWEGEIPGVTRPRLNWSYHTGGEVNE